MAYSTDCIYCGELSLAGGRLVCDECAKRIPRCPKCVGTGIKHLWARDSEPLSMDDPCDYCGGSGVSPDAPLERCYYSGRRYCDNPDCAGCRDRAADNAADMEEERRKEERHGIS